MAFLLALVALSILGLVVTGGFYAARQETRISMASDRAQRALDVAETGIAEVLSNWQGERFGLLPPGQTDQITSLAREGSATIDVRRVSERLYLLDSRGGLFADPGIEHRIAVLTRLNSPLFTAGSAALSLSGLALEGDVGVTGADFTPLSWAPVCGAAGGGMAGVILPDDSAVTTAGPAVVSGVPPVVEDPALTAAALTSYGGLTWAELVAVADVRVTGGAFGPATPQLDANGLCQEASATNWGAPTDPMGPCGRYFPVVHSTGSLQLAAGTVGQGILLVEGDLMVGEDVRFYGAVVVQGTLTIDGGGVLLAGNVRAADIHARNPSTVREVWIASSRCAIDRAILNNPALTRAEPIPARSWLDFTALEG
ncbi:MAG: hypothetical protein R3E98_11445 [Gemmatimonadota bacterium]